MSLLAVVAVAAALTAEPVTPKSDEVFFGRVVATAPVVATDASLWVGARRVARRSVLSRRVTFTLHGRPRACDVRVRWYRNGRLVGRSFDYAAYSGPNGVLAERIGTAGSYSPATRPEIYYHALPPGFYRLIVNLAQNSGANTQVHEVTNFQILPRPGHGPKPCENGKVPSAKAAARLSG